MGGADKQAGLILRWQRRAKRNGAQTSVLEADLERATKRDSLEGDLPGQRNGNARKADNAPVWLGSQSVV